MNKLLFILLFLVVSLAYIFDIDKLLARNFNPLPKLKEIYINNSIKLQNNIDKYLKQVNTIEQLQEENTTLKNYKELYLASKNKLDSILKTIKINKTTKNSIQFTQVLSYIKFNDFTKVWINYEKKDDSILGIISDGFAAGIVVNEEGKAKALLNGNDKFNFNFLHILHFFNTNNFSYF